MQSIYKLKCESLDCSFQIWHLRNKEKIVNNGHPPQNFQAMLVLLVLVSPSLVQLSSLQSEFEVEGVAGCERNMEFH